MPAPVIDLTSEHSSPEKPPRKRQKTTKSVPVKDAEPTYSERDDEGGNPSESDTESSNSEDSDGTASAHSDASTASEPKDELHEAIKFMNEKRLRKVLKELSAESPAFEAALWSKLLADPPKARSRAGKTLQQSQATFRWEICKNCKKESKASEERVNGECVYHPGGMEAIWDHEYFDDYDDDISGPRDQVENQEECPEAFEFACCRRLGTAEGCEKGGHIPVSHKRKSRDRH